MKMAGGLVALLDDVAALARLAAASADDIAAATGRAGTKTLGVVIDDAAVTPGYVVGLPPERELPIIFKIAVGSLRNKLLFILPVALLLSAFLPWALTPILMLGGLYLCFEGAEKILHAIMGDKTVQEVAAIDTAAELEARQVSGAIRTDFILSAEIMVIALNELTAAPLLTQAVTLALVGLVVTLLVYGTVGLIVKLDDIGLRLMKSARTAALGRALVHTMPVLLKILSLIGTAAMLWVGGGILIHGLATFGVTGPEHIIHDLAVTFSLGLGTLEWLLSALGAGLIGTAAGGIIAGLLHLRHKNESNRQAG